MSCSGRGPRRSQEPRPSPLNSVFDRQVEIGCDRLDLVAAAFGATRLPLLTGPVSKADSGQGPGREAIPYGPGLGLELTGLGPRARRHGSWALIQAHGPGLRSWGSRTSHGIHEQSAGHRSGVPTQGPGSGPHDARPRRAGGPRRRLLRRGDRRSIERAVEQPVEADAWRRVLACGRRAFARLAGSRHVESPRAA